MRLLVILALALALPAGAISAERGTPNPCALLTPSMATAALSAPAKGYPEVSNSHARHCLYLTKTNARLDLEIGSRSQWAAPDPKLNPPGTIVKAEPQLGEGGSLVVVPGKNRFVLAAFLHGAYYYTVDSPNLSAAAVLGLAGRVHKTVAG